MGIAVVLGLSGLSAAARLVFKGKGREWFLYIASLLGVFWLQPPLAVRGLDFWLPLLAIGLVMMGWALTSLPEERWTRENAVSAGVGVAILVLLGMTRGSVLEGLATPSQPPPAGQVLVAVAVLAGLAGLLAWRSNPGWGLGLASAVLVLVLVILKTPAAALALSMGLRSLAGQGTAQASGLDVRWLGFSYLAFRLIHTLRDRQAGRLNGASLREYVVYGLFFPTYTAGPIDRLERFLRDLRGKPASWSEDFVEGGRRLGLGLFKKFILADGLALMALNSTNAAQVRPGGWAWVLLYAYALQIYFDFSGYTDIAIGLGRLLGFRLPENFNAPYLKANLTLFWNHWHMTLTTWFRGYYFNPLTRSLKRSRWKISSVGVLLLVQVSTMGLIGLWHGVSWNFLIWGLWHGLGLFAQNRWSEWVGPRLGFLAGHPRLGQLLKMGGIGLTFHYVAFGWVWFGLASPALAIRFFSVLAGN